MGAGDELVDVVDVAGTVLRTVTRADVRAANLWHRSVFIVVLDRHDRVAVHQRAAWKDVWPSRWDLCFGGVLDAGESWVGAAARELDEEAGLAVGPEQLERLGSGRYEDDHVREQAEVFLVRSDDPLTFADGEVAAAAWVPLAGLGDWLAEHDVVPDSRALVVPLLPAPAAS